MNYLNNNMVFIIGAARSGTKLLRDVLATHHSINCVPYDSNYVWRLGNEKVKHDELSVEHYNEKSHKRIVKYFSKYLDNSNYLLEKTVSNTIRIPFLLRHFPNAKFIFLFRNGYDVTESVIRQWGSKIEKNYLIKKLKHVPFDQLLNYGYKFIFRQFKKKGRYFWGVNIPGIQEIIEKKTIEEVAAIQWDYCISKMLNDRNKISEKNLLEIYYEDIVLTPNDTFNKILKFIDGSYVTSEINLEMIDSKNIGKYKKNLTEPEYKIIKQIISLNMEKIYSFKKEY